MQRCDSHAGMLANSTIEICSVTWPSDERGQEETRVLNRLPVSSFPASKLAVKISCQPISFIKKANKKTRRINTGMWKMTKILTVIEKKQRNIYAELWLGYLLDDPGFECRRGQGIFSFFQKVQTGFGAHQTSCSMSTGVHSRQTSTRGLNLTTHRLGPKLRTSGVIPPPLTCLRGADTDKFIFGLIYAGHRPPIVETQRGTIVDPGMRYCVPHCVWNNSDIWVRCTLYWLGVDWRS